MKNLLSENMLRFGTKNLSNSAKQELVVTAIMETINQHGLGNVIKKKLAEQAEPSTFGPFSVAKLRTTFGDYQILTGNPRGVSNVKVSAIRSTKNPSIYTVSYDFKDDNNKEASMKADLLVTPTGTTWNTSFKQYNPGVTINNAMAQSVSGAPGSDKKLLDLFGMMAQPGKDATDFVNKVLPSMGIKITVG